MSYRTLSQYENTGYTGVLDFAFSPDGRMLAIGDNWGVRVSDSYTNDGISRFGLAPTLSLLFSPDGKLIIRGEQIEIVDP